MKLIRVSVLAAILTLGAFGAAGAQAIQTDPNFWPPPTLTQHESNDGTQHGIKATWKAKTGANRYCLMYWIHGMQDWEYVRCVEGLEFTHVDLIDNNRYYYLVQAYNVVGDTWNFLDVTNYSSLWFTRPDRSVAISLGTAKNVSLSKYRADYPGNTGTPTLVEIRQYRNIVYIHFKFPGSHTHNNIPGEVRAIEEYNSGTFMGTNIVFYPTDTTKSTVILSRHTLK